MDEAADLIEARGYASYLPELLRLKGSVLLLMSKVNAADAETCFKQSFEVSSMQGSRARLVADSTETYVCSRLAVRIRMSDFDSLAIATKVQVDGR